MMPDLALCRGYYAEVLIKFYIVSLITKYHFIIILDASYMYKVLSAARYLQPTQHIFTASISPPYLSLMSSIYFAISFLMSRWPDNGTFSFDMTAAHSRLASTTFAVSLKICRIHDAGDSRFGRITASHSLRIKPKMLSPHWRYFQFDLCLLISPRTTITLSPGLRPRVRCAARRHCRLFPAIVTI